MVGDAIDAILRIPSLSLSAGIYFMYVLDFEPEHNRQFYLLWDAVFAEPWKVPELIALTPSLVEETNLTGETVIYWFITENDFERVKLLHDCGAPIDPYALSEICSLGHVEMIELLLCWNVIPDIASCKFNLSAYWRSNAKAYKRRVKAIFRKYGFPLD